MHVCLHVCMYNMICMEPYHIVCDYHGFLFPSPPTHTHFNISSPHSHCPEVSHVNIPVFVLLYFSLWYTFIYVNTCSTHIHTHIHKVNI